MSCVPACQNTVAYFTYLWECACCPTGGSNAGNSFETIVDGQRCSCISVDAPKYDHAQFACVNNYPTDTSGYPTNIPASSEMNYQGFALCGGGGAYTYSGSWCSDDGTMACCMPEAYSSETSGICCPNLDFLDGLPCWSSFYGKATANLGTYCSAYVVPPPEDSPYSFYWYSSEVRPTVAPVVPPNFTASPTESPYYYWFQMFLPTVQPTPSPSVVPGAPTQPPHPSPSRAPTHLPSAMAALPTVTPSFRPSPVPTIAPSAIPSMHPTLAPTFQSAPIISFDASLSLTGFTNTSELNTASQGVVASAVCLSMNVSTPLCSYVIPTQFITESHRTLLDTSSNNSYTAKSVVSILVPMVRFPQYSDANELFSLLTASFLNASDSGEFIENMRLLAATDTSVSTELTQCSFVGVEWSALAVQVPPTFAPTFSPSRGHPTTSGLPAAAIIGIAAGGGALFLGALITAIVCCCFRKKSSTSVSYDNVPQQVNPQRVIEAGERSVESREFVL